MTGRFAITGFASRVRSHLNNPLYMNAYLLVCNHGISAGLGFLYWILAARFFSTEVVGRGAAIISILGLLSAFAELSLKSGMQRFVPRSGKHVGRLVLLGYAANLLAAGSLTTLFIIAGRLFHFSDTMFGEVSRRLLVSLIIANMFYTVFIVQDGVLIGLRQTVWVLVENTIYNLSKIAVLMVSVSGWLWNGVVTSWFLSTPLAVLLVNGLIFFRFVPKILRNASNQPAPVQARQVISSVTGDHVGTILAETSTRLIPLLVINLLGNSANAFFNQAWLIGSMLYLVSTNVSASFTVESASYPNNLSQLSRQALRQTLLIITPLAIGLLVVSPIVLSVFSEVYAIQGTALLRWLALAAIPYGVNAWFLGYSRVRGDSKSIIIVQGLQCVITLGLSAWLMPSLGIQAIGIAWLTAQTIIALLELIGTREILLNPQESRNKVKTSFLQLIFPDLDFTAKSSPKPETTGEQYYARTPAVFGRGEAVYLFLSPHLDDVVLSCSGYLFRLSQAGEEVVIATIFTADPPKEDRLSWLARRNLRAWGLENVEQPFLERRLEDREAANLLGVETVYFGCLDALYRHRSDGTFFYTRKIVDVAVDPEDRDQTGQIIQTGLTELAERLTRTKKLKVFIPLGVGRHVDHIITRSAAEAVFNSNDLIYYEDFPYARRINNHRTPVMPGMNEVMSWISVDGDEVVPKTWKPTRIILTQDEINARVAAAKCYSSQIRGLFPTISQRNLEILSTRIPWADPLLDSLFRRILDQETSRSRMEKIMRDYIYRVGGENYWHQASMPVAYREQPIQVKDAI